MAEAQTEFPARCSSGYTLIGVGAIALVAAIFQVNAALLALATVLIAGPLWILFSLRHASGKLVIERTAPATAFEGDEIEITFRLRNDSERSLFFPMICDVFSPELHEKKRLLHPHRIHPGETVVQRFSGHCLLPRGIYPLGPTSLRICDPFGLFEVRKEYEAEPFLKVYPRLVDIGLERVVGQAIDADQEDRLRRRVGSSNEFVAVRDYRWGDSPRSIHWGLTAHMGHPVVREYSPRSTGNLALFLDLHREGMVGWGRNSSLDYGVRICASVAARALRAGRHVEFHCGTGSEQRVPVGNGASQLERILDVLVGVRASRKAIAFPELLMHVGPRLAAGSTLILTVSPYLFDSPEFLGAIDTLRRRGHRIVALVFDGDTFRRLWEEGGEPSTPVWPEAIPSAGRFAHALRARGMEAIVIESGAYLEATFAEASFTETQA